MSEPPKKKIDQESLRLYSKTMATRWEQAELYTMITPTTPIFVYCTLMLPWVLARVLNITDYDGIEEMIGYTTRATLQSYFRTQVKTAGMPTIVHTTQEAAVDGILIGGLEPHAMAKIDTYIGPGLLKKETVEVEIELRDGNKVKVAALTYVWDGPMETLEAKHWTPLDFMRDGSPEA
ncbi:hypothetical protein BS50DRAFT_588815 [Corynespora cassiicola Philippines]|uniref:Putative gamma-glutamylcyclotransferase n=1 Tax=Corynespora cassiicola Philippines TaxID=1448308 RepID=A0A2T2NKS2_CORCC|nr:hypothetical protein BS50DRAFT_588815 [Corynespora cassiicola Philippines]